MQLESGCGKGFVFMSSSQDGKANQARYNENDKNHSQETVFVRNVEDINVLCFVFHF